MTFFRSRLAAAWLIAAGAASFAPAAMAQDLELTIMAPAGAGGGWDSAARALQEVMMSTGNARSVQVVNVPGAGGTVGLAQFVQGAAGSPNQLLVGGITMVGAVLTNKSPVTLEAVTPIARRRPAAITAPSSRATLIQRSQRRANRLR